MDIEWVRRCCLSFPHTSEKVQWGNNLVFKIAEKIYAIAALEPGEIWLSFKCAPDEFAELIERPGIVPAPYLARAQWVALEREDAAARRSQAAPAEVVRPRAREAAQEGAGRAG